MNLFIPIYGKSIHLLEYKSQQHQETGSVIKYLKETWVEKITQSVRLCLRDIGKGWFDLEQRRHDIYDVMKLKRFMDLIVYRMQVLRKKSTEVFKKELIAFYKNVSGCTIYYTIKYIIILYISIILI